MNGDVVIYSPGDLIKVNANVIIRDSPFPTSANIGCMTTDEIAIILATSTFYHLILTSEQRIGWVSAGWMQHVLVA